jgi:hypothetical protein
MVSRCSDVGVGAGCEKRASKCEVLVLCCTLSTGFAARWKDGLGLCRCIVTVGSTLAKEDGALCLCIALGLALTCR